MQFILDSCKIRINYIYLYLLRGEIMMKTAIITDSTSYIPEKIRQQLNIHMIPLSIVFGHNAYREDVDITTEEFYNKVRHTDELPTTSQPSIGMFVDLYEKLKADGYESILTIHLSKKISGTYQAAVSAGNMVDGIDVYAYDSEISAMPQGFYAIEAAHMSQKNKTPDQIIARLDEIKQTVRAYFMVDDLSHLQRGGRLSGAQALLGGLLRIKPVLHFIEGEIHPFEKIRTRKKAIQRILDMLEEDVAKQKVEHVVFIHGNDEKSAEELRDAFNEEHPNIETSISYFGPVVGTHLGEGSIGVSWYTKEED